jgi:hypothetical protein
MYKTVHVLRALCVLSVLASGCATIQIPEEIAETPTLPTPVTFATSFDPLVPPAFAELESAQPANAPVSKALSLDLGLQVVNLKSSFFEKKENVDALSGALEGGLSRSYLNLLATSSPPGGGLQAEGEFSYTMLDSPKARCGCEEEPRMLRLSLKDRWAGFSFGADYRSLGKGFVFVNGQRIDQPRDEGQFWGEHGLGPFNLRGSVGESWERLADGGQFRLTRTASTTVNFNRPAWNSGWISSFSRVGEGVAPAYDTTVFTQTFTSAYRPINGLSLGSNFTFKQEHNVSTGLRTDSPGAGLTFSYVPLKDRISLTGVTSYARSFSADGSSNTGTVNLLAGINWKLGKFLAKDDVLSFSLRYNRQLDFISPSASHDDFGGMLQLKVAGF